MAAPAKRRLTAEERRTGILDAALAVFSERGYHEASIDEIAGEAGVSKALIYEHFSSKQELYGELIARNARDLTQRVAGALSGVEVESTAERLATGLEAFFAFVEERRAAWRILFRDPSDPESAAVLDRMVGQVTAEVTVLISQDPGARDLTRGQADQSLRLLAEMLVGGAQSMANWWTDHPDTPRAELVAIAMDFAWLGLERLSRGDRWSVPE
ncbi:MAG TPA: TetR/AcrR family transcriptional regulator [Thermoleophilaceae bacterium]|jgi:AcrR family transcriptional regulator|nr:TetR/AcrR family transcriptional regulator [Thermoleophilaceae bacterium]